MAVRIKPAQFAEIQRAGISSASSSDDIYVDNALRRSDGDVLLIVQQGDYRVIFDESGSQVTRPVNQVTNNA